MRIVLKIAWWLLATVFFAALFLVPYEWNNEVKNEIAKQPQHKTILQNVLHFNSVSIQSKVAFFHVVRQAIDSINSYEQAQLRFTQNEQNELLALLQQGKLSQNQIQTRFPKKAQKLWPFVEWLNPSVHSNEELIQQLVSYNNNVAQQNYIPKHEQSAVLIRAARAATSKFFHDYSRYFLIAFILLLLVTVARIFVIQFQSGEFTEAYFKPKSVFQQLLAYAFGSTLIGFYVVLYWSPEWLSEWIILTDGLSLWLSGSLSNQWFLYGFMYTAVVSVMALRILRKYKGSSYHFYRTVSIVFFQLIFAFIIPQVLYALQLPAIDLKNSWPLDYSLFFEYRIQEFIQSGAFGVTLLVWSIALFLVVVPVFTYKYGKRWYCSWVCGCGGLAETAGDTFRHLSNKSELAHKLEKVLIYSVLVLVVVLTIITCFSLFTTVWLPFGWSVNHLQQWYGFLIGAVFAGVVGTGFYPLLGNRVWCRFGCPLAAYMGIIQKFKSRFRVTTNGGQCISCGACSVSCEMGIDVRAYAQQKKDVVRASCVGCGICESVCPRGVLKLENKSVESRVVQTPLLITKHGVLLQHNSNAAND